MRGIIPVLLTFSFIFGSMNVASSAAINTGPSFDCNRASTPTEYAICSNESLSRLDRTLANSYKGAKRNLKKGSTNLKALRDRQRQWNKKKSSKCGSNVQCLSRFYQERINNLAASARFYTVKNGRFFTDEGEVPLGCFAELMTELNGDDNTAAVYLNRTIYRGCIGSNKHDISENKNYKISIEKERENNIFWIKFCELIDGSMGQYCDKLIIQFVKRRYLNPEGNKDVVSIEKLGNWN